MADIPHGRRPCLGSSFCCTVAPDSEIRGTAVLAAAIFTVLHLPNHLNRRFHSLRVILVVDRPHRDDGGYPADGQGSLERGRPEVRIVCKRVCSAAHRGLPVSTVPWPVNPQRPENPGEVTTQLEADGRQTGNNDAEGHLRARQDHGIGVVPRRVDRVAGLVDAPQPDAGCDGDKNP